MRISQKGIDLIKKYEGCILQSYDDYSNQIVNAGDIYSGTLTIGFGHTENVYAGQTITEDQANEMLISDMVKYSEEVQEVINEGTITFEYTQNMFDALVSFDYNLGQGNLRTLCRNRDKQTVADKMLLYINPGSVWEKGLLKRRQAERDLFLSDSEKTENTPQAASQNIYSQLQTLLNYYCFKDKKGNYLKVDGIPGELTLSACPLLKKGTKSLLV